MQLKEIYRVVDAFAPFRLSEEYCAKYGAFDNSGILIDCGKQITGVLFALDLTVEAVEVAIKKGYDCIVTHHPAIYAPISSLKREVPLQRAILTAIERGISVISAHLNLDVCDGGIDECLMQALGGENPQIHQPLSSGGYGRAYAWRGDGKALVEQIKRVFKTERVIAYNLENSIQRVASFCGAGMSEDTIAFTEEGGAQAIVTSDGKHHLILDGVERGLTIVLLPHYTAEEYGFEKFYQKIKGELKVACEFYTDLRLV